MENRIMFRQNAAGPASLRAAAVRIGVSLPTLYKLIGRGKLRTYHIGRAHRVSAEAVRDCIALLEQESCAGPSRKPRQPTETSPVVKTFATRETKCGN